MLFQPVNTQYFNLPGFTSGGNLNRRLNSYIDYQNDLGAKCDGVTDDTPAFNKFVAICNANAGSPYATALWTGKGRSRIKTAPNVFNKAPAFVSPSDGSFNFAPEMATDFIQIIGSANRITQSSFVNTNIDAVAMTGGNAITLDWTVNTLFSAVTITRPWAGISIRQSGLIRHAGTLLIDTFRGDFGYKAFGTGVLRNGELDRCDAIDFDEALIQGDYVPGGAARTTPAMWLDGAVATFTGKVRLLSCGRGFLSQNTPARPQNDVPSYIIFDCLEVEQTYLEGIRAGYANQFCPRYVFTATTVSEYGVYLGFVSNGSFKAGVITSAWKGGATVNGTVGFDFGTVNIYDNNQSVAGFSGVEVAVGDNISAGAGQIGKRSGWVAYTENQKYGINNIGGTNVRAIGTDLRGNVTAQTLGAVTLTATI